jgi:hypothetical protein
VDRGSIHFVFDRGRAGSRAMHRTRLRRSHGCGECCPRHRKGGADPRGTANTNAGADCDAMANTDAGTDTDATADGNRNGAAHEHG